MNDIKPKIDELIQASVIENSEKDNISIMRSVLPTIITLLALCAGLTAISLSFDHHFEKAIMLILLAATLDGFDGRVARLLKVSSEFGAQLDSLADAINFGVAPGLLLYSYMLYEAKHIGWIAVLLYTIACCLRLARFNATLDNNDLEQWQKRYFTGVPAPAGALLVLLPLYLGSLGVQYDINLVYLVCGYTFVIALLMVSTLPVWNGKDLAVLMRRNVSVVLMLFLTAYVAFMVCYPWETLAATAFLYIIFLPISFYIYRMQYLAFKKLKNHGKASAKKHKESNNKSDNN